MRLLDTLNEMTERKTGYENGKDSDFVWTVLNREIKKGNRSCRMFSDLSVYTEGNGRAKGLFENGFRSYFPYSR